MDRMYSAPAPAAPEASWALPQGMSPQHTAPDLHLDRHSAVPAQANYIADDGSWPHPGGVNASYYPPLHPAPKQSSQDYNRVPSHRKQQSLTGTGGSNSSGGGGHEQFYPPATPPDAANPAYPPAEAKYPPLQPQPLQRPSQRPATPGAPSDAAHHKPASSMSSTQQSIGSMSLTGTGGRLDSKLTLQIGPPDGTSTSDKFTVPDPSKAKQGAKDAKAHLLHELDMAASAAKPPVFAGRYMLMAERVEGGQAVVNFARDHPSIGGFYQYAIKYVLCCVLIKSS